MKSIIFILLAQFLAIADASIFPLLREGMKRNPSLLLLFVTIFPALLAGLFLALTAVREMKANYRFIAGIAIILVNIVLILLHFRGYVSFSSLSFPLLLTGYGAGILLDSWQAKK